MSDNLLTSSPSSDYLLDGSLPFSDYISQCRNKISTQRLDLNQHDKEKIIAANTPYELSPSSTVGPKIGALLTHGLWDSPFSLKEIALVLQQNNVLCRSILLPGHGTHPNHLQKVTYQDWIKETAYGIQSLKQKVEKIYLIGYSAGAALSLYHALQDEDIAGLILLAPAIQIKPFVDLVFNWHYLTKWMARKREWIYQESENDYAKYKSIGFNPAFQIYQLTQSLKNISLHKKLNCPILMTLSTHDETISSQAAMNFFCNTVHPRNKLIMYATKEQKFEDKRILFRSSQYPELGIINFSHISLPFSVNNLHYGIQGDFYEASHQSETNLYGAYNRLGENFYMPFYKYGLLKKCRRGLTYNPDFDFMANAMVDFIKSTSTQTRR